MNKTMDKIGFTFAVIMGIFTMAYLVLTSVPADDNIDMSKIAEIQERREIRVAQYEAYAKANNITGDEELTDEEKAFDREWESLQRKEDIENKLNKTLELLDLK